MGILNLACGSTELAEGGFLSRTALRVSQLETVELTRLRKGKKTRWLLSKVAPMKWLASVYGTVDVKV